MTDPRDDVSRYAAAVRAALADLDPVECAQLLEDLEGHLAEVAAETDGPLTDRLGPAEAYAAELRAAYGARARASFLERLVALRRRGWPSRRWRLACLAFFLVVGVAAAGTLVVESGQLSAGDRWSYSQLVAQARAGHVRSLTVTGNSYVATDRAGGKHDVVGVSVTMPLAAEMVRDGVDVSYQSTTTVHWAFLAAVVVPNLLLLLVIGFVVRFLVRAAARLRLAGAARR